MFNSSNEVFRWTEKNTQKNMFIIGPFVYHKRQLSIAFNSVDQDTVCKPSNALWYWTVLKTSEKNCKKGVFYWTLLAVKSDEVWFFLILFFYFFMHQDASFELWKDHYTMLKNGKNRHTLPCLITQHYNAMQWREIFTKVPNFMHESIPMKQLQSASLHKLVNVTV